DGADDLAGFQASAGQQGGGAHGAPTAAAGRVDEPAEQAERDEEAPADGPAEAAGGHAPGGEADQEVEAEGEEDRGHDRFGDLGGQPAQEGRPGEGAHRAGQGDASHHLPVDVAQPPVRHAGGEGGADLGEVDRGRGGRGVGADEQQEGGGGDAVGHA